MRKFFVAAAVSALLASAAMPAFADSEGGGPGWQAPIGAKPVHTTKAPVAPPPAQKFVPGTCNHDVNGHGCWLFPPHEGGGG